ncbi:Ig-like domain-containing protein [Paenibacillus montanisoli]|uniref:Ig-like domain-containing protein n=1 Tax=Paenibacillus montanisoli TaxID=2081970 RepID=UPI0014025586|nr:Ig-like domain-containing protein [Paenibacillus montanisoli]
MKHLKMPIVWVMCFLMVFTLSIPYHVSADTMSFSLRVGEKLPLQAIIELPALEEEANGLKIKWISSDQDIAKVDSNDTLIGVSKGNVTIRASIDGIANPLAELQVQVISTVQGVELDKTTLSLALGQTSELKAYVKPYNAYLQEVKWQTTDRNIVTVSKDGKLTATGIGEATITAVTTDGGYSATCKITVSSNTTGIQVSKEFVLPVGQKKTINAQVVPNNGYNQEFWYTIADPRIAKIDSKGVITPLHEGSTSVTLMTKDKRHSTVITIRVTSNIEHFYVADKSGKKLSSLTLKAGQEFPLFFIGDPNDFRALDHYHWSVINADKRIASIDSKGKLKGLSAGTTTLTFTLKEEAKLLTHTLQITVVSTVKSVELNKTKTKLPVGGSEQLKATVMPLNAFLKEVKWTSSNSKVVSVNPKTGQLKGLSIGTAIITATTTDGKKVATCNVTVYGIAKSIYVPSTSLKVTMGSNYSFTAKVLPILTINNEITYKLLTTNGAKIVQVKKGKDGLFTLTGLKPGETQLELTSKDGGHKKIINIQVVPTEVKVVITKP